MKQVPIVSHPAYQAELPDGHRFPMRKYGRLAEVIAEKGLAPNGFVTPDEASADVIALAHDRAYVDQVLACSVSREIERHIGLPISASVVRRARSSAAGTLLAARLALQHGLACNTAGGSHHGQSESGAGFCVFNDVAIAAKALRREGTIGQVLVVDLDVHQGDGTADCLRDEPDLFTFSMHGEKNYPVRKIPSDLDIGLPDGMEDDAYLDALRPHLPRLLDAHRAGPRHSSMPASIRIATTARAACADRRRVSAGGTLGDRACPQPRLPALAVIGGGYADSML